MLVYAYYKRATCHELSLKGFRSISLTELRQLLMWNSGQSWYLLNPGSINCGDLTSAKGALDASLLDTILVSVDHLLFAQHQYTVSPIRCLLIVLTGQCYFPTLFESLILASIL